MFQHQEYEIAVAENAIYFRGDDELARWKKVLANFSTIIQFFFHYWCLKYDNDKDKKMMYEEACHFGQQNITKGKKGFSNVTKVLLEEKIYNHWVERMKDLIATRFLHNSIYFYTDDVDVNRILEEFLCVKKIELKEGADISVEFKSWLETKSTDEE